ncbi:hypothetical protein BDR22DRAFT_304780 [Usnea florida]
MSSRTENGSIFGTRGLPYIICATIAFGGGIALYYRSCLKQALIALEKYPSLMLLHLDCNYPTKRWSMSGVRALLDRMDNGWVHRSMLVTCWQSAGPALDVSRLSRKSTS